MSTPGGRGRGAARQRRPTSSRSGAATSRPSAPARRPSGQRTRPAGGTPRPEKVGRAVTTAAGLGPIAGYWRSRLAASNGRALRGLALATIVVVLLVLLAPTLNAYLGQRSEVAAWQAKVADQERAVAELRQEQERWKDRAYVEQQARKRLKYAYPGERSFTVIDPSDPGGTSAKVSLTTGAATQPWYSTVWTSMTIADVPASQRP